MSYMTMKSDNEKFSWVLCKNPESGMSIQSTRQGYSFGWFEEGAYNLLFKDGLDKMSYPETKGQFEYLDRNRYCHPLSYVNLINDFLRSTLREELEEDVPANAKITLHCVQMKSASLLKHFKTHMKDVTITEEVVNDCLFEVTFSGSGTFHKLLNHVMLCCLLMGGEMSYRLTKMNDTFVDKYVGIINKLELPYFIRYIFARNFFIGDETFKKFAPQLETENIKLTHGDTGMQRLRHIEKIIPLDKEVIDIGCGEGTYALNLPKKMSSTYHAIDIDEDLVSSVQRRANAREYDLQSYTSLGQFKEGYKESLVDVLLVEVIEHMPLADATALIEDAMSLNFENLIITTPNKDFNKNYSLGEEFRHDDHDWEMNAEEFQNYIKDLVGDQYGYEFLNIGDSVDGEYTTQGVVVKNTDIQKRAVLTVGISASGKTQWAEQFVNRTKNWVNINRDDIRFDKIMKGNRDWRKYKFTDFAEKKVTKEAEKRISMADVRGDNIIISDTNLNPKSRTRMTNKLEDMGYAVEIKEFPVEIEEAWKRDTYRSNGVGAGVIYNQYKQWLVYKGQQMYIPDETKTKTISVDIDGTLAEFGGGRGPFDWDRVYQDELRVHIRDMIWGYQNQGYNIVFVSGRDECCRELTEKWLEEVAEVFYDKLYMRPEGSYEKDTVVKERILFEDLAPNYNIVAHLDDRPSVCRHLRLLGVNVISVADPHIEF